VVFVAVGISGLKACFSQLHEAISRDRGGVPWHGAAARIYAGAMNEAIRPGSGDILQASIARQLSIIVPTFNESGNITALFERLKVSLDGTSWEVIFVDDNSPDGTWQAVRALAQQDARVRCLRRVGRRGLSGACIEGILASSAPYVAVMDADLQHDETQLPKMLALLQSGDAELVVGSRYVEGGSADSFNRQRRGVSEFATMIAKRLLRVEIADPMSGFFMIRRDRFEQLAPQLSVHGFKILLDVVATARGQLRTVEIPFTFGSRLSGESKLDSMVALDFLGLILAKLTGDAVSLRFLLFALVGSVGLFVHLFTLDVAFNVFDVRFTEAHVLGAVVAMTSNFLLNNFLTYRDQRLRGFSILPGLLLFYLVCSVGLLANVGVAFSVYDQRPIWWLAGAAGALMGVVWNYAMSGVFVWRKR
jgi:dolichol-phosphate mannosyltransferase